ncbi:MAG: ATP-binding protein [Filifactoraceae bacterium]
MIRRVIKIDEDKCVGCGICAKACHEGAIGIVDGKAKLLKDDYCDGLGNCLPTCPTGAISFEEREAASYNKAIAPKRTDGSKKSSLEPIPSGVSELRQWPIQIKLVPVVAPYFQEADLLIAADCSAFAYGNFHEKFLKNKVCIIGCPKLDEVDYTEKLTNIFEANNIRSVTVVRMEVPCCSRLEMAMKAALRNIDKAIKHDVVVVSTDGRILEG